VREDGGDPELAASFLARRDETAFRALYRRHTPALLGLAKRLAGGRVTEAEEIVQEVWARAAEGLSTFRWKSSLRTWLSGFVVNVWRERSRSAARGSAPIEVAGPVDSTPFAPMEHIDLERAVAALPDGFRAVIVLHDIEGFTHEEIADQLGIEPGTSKSQLARARRALRARLSPESAVARRTP
jgi:RNA polymerase sigma-70 factor, ECF subfamily